MGRPIGSSKPAGSGRKKGTPNKITSFCVSARLKEIDYDLVGKIIEDLAALEQPALRIKAHLQLLEYCDARRKSVEVKSQPENDDNQEFFEFAHKEDPELVYKWAQLGFRYSQERNTSQG